MENFEKYCESHQGVTWKEYVDRRFKESEKALTIASKSLANRLEGMNEIRSQLDRQAASFITRDNAALEFEKVVTRINTLEKLRAEGEGRAKAFSVIMSFVGGIIGAVLASLIAYFLIRSQP
jgi:hypothetical protein